MNVHRPHSFSFTEFLAGTPLDEQNKLARRDYLAYCYGTNKTFGEWYVALISDYLGLNWDTTVESVQRLSIYLRAYTIVDDDLRDVPQAANDSFLEPLRKHFLDRAFVSIRSLSSFEIEATENLQAELEKYSHAANFYTKLHSNKEVHNADRVYTEKYADRMALVRVPLLLLASESSRELLVSGLKAIDCLMEALQILDDVVDWKEDLRQGRITYPIVSYLAPFSTHHKSQLRCYVVGKETEKIEESIEALSRDLPYHPVIRNQLEHSCRILTDASRALAKGSGFGLLSKAIDIRKGVSRVLSGDWVPRGCCLERDNLIVGLQQSGVAPQRLAPGRREECLRRTYIN